MRRLIVITFALVALVVFPGVIIKRGPGGSGGHIIEEEGSALAQRTTLNFTGAGSTCADAGGKTVCTITSGGGSGTMTTVKENDVGVGGADIVTLDFLGADFDLAESPDTEIQIIIASAIARDAEMALLYEPLLVNSAGLLAALDDETGTGLAVFSASPTFSGIVTMPIAATPTTDADGEVSFDTDGWGTNFDALELFNGTASAYVVATTASDTPTNGQVPKWNTGGEITWEADNSAGSPSFDGITTGDNTNQAFTISGTSSLSLGDGGNIESNLQLLTVNNDSGATLQECSAVYISGFDIPSALPEVSLADADNASAVPAVGLVVADITNGSNGYVAVGGNLQALDTNTGEGWAVGEAVYLNDSGTSADDDCGNTLTNVRPANVGDNIQKIGIVVRVNAATGAINVVGAGRSNDVPNLEDGKLWIGNGSNVATAVDLSGDVTTTNAGVTTVSGATGTVTWSGTSVLESGAAFGFGDGTDATLTHTYGNTGTDVVIAYTTGAMAVTGALSATSITAGASATPTLAFDDSVASDSNEEAKIVANAIADDNGSISLQVENNGDGTYYEGILVKSTAGTMSVQLGGNGTADYVNIADNGAMTFAGTGSIDLETGTAPITGIADTQILVGSGAGTGAYVTMIGDATLANTGSLTIGAAKVDPAMLATQTKSMYWGAGAMEVDATGCTAPAAVALVTSGPTPLTIACADSDTATISGSTSMPDGWDGSTVIFTLVLGQIGASTGAYEMDFEGQCITSDSPFLAFAGTGEQPAQITLTADDDMLEDDTAAVTLNGGGCSGGDMLVWRGAIDATASAASIETLAVVVGVKMEYGWNSDD